jgi:hypothetical protein
MIRKKITQHFRWLEKFATQPRSGMNAVPGGGGVGKTTVLKAAENGEGSIDTNLYSIQQA